MSQVRTRFAPSPTGSLHLGNLRVAVFNHLFARHHGGAFVLRIEDTDTDRNVEGSLEGILSDLRWAGLDWDEGPETGGPFGPYRQSERGEGYLQAARRLAQEGRTYPCFCADEEVEAARDGGREDPACPGGCRTLDDDERRRRREGEVAHVVRFAIPAGTVAFEDEVRGTISLSDKDVGDFIILRADGRPTYNFAVVVDDVGMQITHVVRGAGHLSNTPKQALLFDALGEPRPVFAHLPMVLGADRKKLSKREGTAGVEDLRTEGFHPDGVVNYLSLLGWSPGDDREVLDRAELVREMDLSRIGASDTVFDPDKLRWVSQQHIARMSDRELAEGVAPFVDTSRFPLDADELVPAVQAIRTRLTTFAEVNQHLQFLFPDASMLQQGRGQLKDEPGAHTVLEAVHGKLESLGPWTPEQLDRGVREAGKEVGASGRGLFHPVRLAISGVREGPDLGHLLAGLGRERTLKRIENTLESL